MTNLLSTRTFAALLGAATLMGCAATGTHRPDGGTTPLKPIVRPDPQPEPEPAEVDRVALRAALAKRRADNVGHFLAYRDRGVYPRNTYTAGSLNVWIDEEGRTCAAATMIRESGYEDLVQATARTNNFIVLADVHEGALYDWMLTSGLTQEEIAAIQAPMIGPDGGVEWDQQMVVDETTRLRIRYDEVAGMLEVNTEAGLDLAVERLAGDDALAAEVIAADAAVAARRDELRAVLAERRAANIASFVAYRDRGVYPLNTFDAGERNIWIDALGRTCAAATMIGASGATALVAETAKQDNFIALSTVRGGALMDWMLTSGLTQEEVALIQRPFVGRPEPVEDTRSWEEIETARLRGLYDSVASTLALATDASLDLAVDRLLAHPRVAASLG